MPIVNTVIAGEGGGQGGGDKVTALVGSNASGIDVGDKVILNYPAVNETGYCTEYRFQDQTYNSGQWAIFFGEYMMYVDTSGHPVFLKHDAVNDKLVYLGRSNETLEVFPTPNTQGADYNNTMKVTYNETTKRFATCKLGSLKIYQATIDEATGIYGVEQIGGFSTINACGGISQSDDVLWYLQTAGDADSIVVQDFSVLNGSLVAGDAYTHTNSCVTWESSGTFACFMSPSLDCFAFFKSGTNSSYNGRLSGCIVDKENKTITYSSSQGVIAGGSDTAASAFYYVGYCWDIWLDDNGRGVLWQPGYNNTEQSQAFLITSSSSSMVGSIVSSSVTGSIRFETAWRQPGIVHKVNGWLTGNLYAFKIDENTGSYIRSANSSRWTSGSTSYYAHNISQKAALSITGLFIYPYMSSLIGSNPIPFINMFVYFNGGSPVRGNTPVLPQSTIGRPYYFDGSYLYATGGVYATTGDGLERIGNSTLLDQTNYPNELTPIFLPTGIGFCTGSSSSLAICNNGVITGSIGNESGVSFAMRSSDARFDSTNTGFINNFDLGSGNDHKKCLYFKNGAYVSGGSTSGIAGFFDASGNCYLLTSNTLYSVTYENNSVVTTSLFSTSISSAMTNTRFNLSVLGDRVDNYQIWVVGYVGIKGFTKLDLNSSQIYQVQTPSAIQQVSGTVYAAWWDLDNRLFIRTSTGLYVFSYTNHDISTMQLVKKFEWDSAYAGPATCSNDLKSYAVGNGTYIKVVREADMPIYEFSANVYNGHNFAGTSLTGFVNEAITTDPWGQSIVKVDTYKDPADTWTNVGTPFGFDVSTTSSDVSVGWGYYNSGSAEVIFPSTVTKTLSQASSGQTKGFKNDVVVYKDTLDNNSALICKTGTTPVGTFKASTALTTPVYLSPDKTVIMGTDADSGFDVSYEAYSETTTNYAVVGSPAIDSNYVASNFSSSNYLKLPTSFSPGSSTWEIVLKVRPTASAVGYIFAKPYNTWVGLNISMTGSDTVQVIINTTSSTSTFISLYSNGAVALNQDVYMKVSWDGSTYAFYLSNDGVTWTLKDSAQSSTPLYSYTADSIFGNVSSYPFNGKIYLEDCYIKVGDQIWWRGVTPATDGSVTVGEGYHYNSETDAPFYLGSDLTRSATQMVVHPEDFVEQTDYTPHFNVFGSPTIVNRVASNFSNDNYLVLPEAFTPSSSTWEIRMKVTTGDSVTSTHCYYFSNLDTASNSLVLGTDPTGQFYFYVSSNGTSWNIASAVGTYVAQPNTTYYIKFSFTGSVYKLEVSTDGENWTTSGSVTSSSTVYQNGIYYLGAGFGKSSGNQWPGSIDLSECYIKVGNDIWWSAYTTETTKQGTLFLTQPTAGTTSSVVSANATPTAAYVGSVVDPIDMGKTVTMDTTLTKILAVEDA